MIAHRILLASLLTLFATTLFAGDKPTAFLQKHCVECHNKDTHEGNLDLTDLKFELASPENFSRWVKVHDRIELGEMPPKEQPRPEATEKAALLESLAGSLAAAEKARLAGEDRTGVRRLTRSEYENTIRDLFTMPGIALQGSLPADGSAHGFDKNSDALDISHVNMSKYVDAADHTLNHAIAVRPEAPEKRVQRVSLARHVGHILGNGDAVLLRDKKHDPEYLPAGEQGHIDQGAHERIGSFERLSSVGVFRHEDESFNPYYQEFTTIYPAMYRIRASFWSCQWDKGAILPSRGVEAARLSVVALNDNGRGGGHPSTVIGYFDAPSMDAQVHEFTMWLNAKETFGFNTASLAPVANYNRKGRSMAFTGPCIVSDWLDVEGPIHDVWPPKSHKLLFGELPIVEVVAKDHPNTKFPKRPLVRQQVLIAKNQADKITGFCTVSSEQPLADADRLLASFLPKAFRRPVPEEVRKAYLAQVDERLKAGDCFELAMRWVYRAALCSPDFLYHVENKASDGGRLDDHSLACRLSYFFWNSLPDDELRQLADQGKLHDSKVLKAQADRLLADPKSQRFIDDFLGQWLKLRAIAANDPDKKLYPEFSAYLQDSMVAETRAYFRELIKQDLNASYLVKSDFAMLNEKLAKHYGIDSVSGPQIRRVQLPADHPRGPFLTQAAIMKITANGTTTSPVPRGAFVMARLLGQEPEPPPPNIAAIEPDVRGATTIREQLDKHRSNAVCASCHARMDPPGFALEAFDVIGGWRDRYRAIDNGDPAPRGSIDPFIGISFRLGPKVDASGMLPDGRTFKEVTDFQKLLAEQSDRLLQNLAQQLTIYSTGRDVTFADRVELNKIVAGAKQSGGGVKSLIHQVVLSELFQEK